MKRIVLISLCLAFLTGCVASLYTKQIQVHRDANGNITGTTEIETVQQQGSTESIHFNHLKVGK